jgi:hypothetical protein
VLVEELAGGLVGRMVGWGCAGREHSCCIAGGGSAFGCIAGPEEVEGGFAGSCRHDHGLSHFRTHRDTTS